MPEQTLPPTPPMPEQVRVPYAPHRDDPGKRRFRNSLAMSVQESYRHNQIRLTIPGQGQIDVIPAGEPVASSVPPGTLFGAESAVWIVSGCNTYGRLSTVAEQVATTAVLHERLDGMEWTWHPAVLMAAGREWVETGAVVLGVSRDEIVSRALRHGQEAVLLWDENGISVVSTGLSEDVVDGPPVAVTTSPALLGCPMRFGAQAKCTRVGGPFGSRAMAVATQWELHRDLLVGALGCTVCEGGVVCGNGRPIAISSAFVPSRRGGWQWGPPLSDAAMEASWGDDDEDDEDDVVDDDDDDELEEKQALTPVPPKVYPPRAAPAVIPPTRPGAAWSVGQGESPPADAPSPAPQGSGHLEIVPDVRNRR